MATSGCSAARLPRRPVRRARWLPLATLFLACGAYARSPAAVTTGLVAFTEGPRFTIIRGDELRTGTRGVTLQSGDIIETGAESFLVVQLQDGPLVGIGPGSSVYFTEDGGSLALLVRAGWVKADFRASAAGTVLRGRLAGPHLSVQCEKGVVLLHASPGRDDIFDEQGEATLAQGASAAHVDPKMRAGELATSDNLTDIVVKPRPSAEFLAAMPQPFRDALPVTPASPVKAAETQSLRKVSYGDIEPWLTAQSEWRAGFVQRFKGRLKDPVFFAAMDAHLTALPEWTVILHPPLPPHAAPEAPSDKPPGAGEPAQPAEAAAAPSPGDPASAAPAGDKPAPAPGDETPPPAAPSGEPPAGDKPPGDSSPPQRAEDPPSPAPTPSTAAPSGQPPPQ